MDKNKEIATLGAGCFWGVEALFQKLEGVVSTRVGYCGRELENPTYQDICTGQTGHAEVIEIIFDNTIISFSEILNYFWRLHDPTTLNAQGADFGTQYRSVIFFHNDEQKNTALVSMIAREESGLYKNPIVTEITSIQKFYEAEDYHQAYYQKKYQGGEGQICHFLRNK